MNTLIILLLGVAVLSLSGCNQSLTVKSNENSRSTSGGSIASAHETVVETLKKWITVKSFRQRFTSTSAGVSSKGEMEFVAPDRVHLVMEIAGEPFESITIGNTEYTKDVDGIWKETTVQSEQGTSTQGRFFADPRYVADLANNVSDARFIGTETDEATSLQVYRFKHKLPNSEAVYESRLWVTVTDGLPRKLETTYDFISEGVRQSGKASSIYSDYNTDIRIDAPNR